MSLWQETKLGKTGTVITGKTPSKDNPEDWGADVIFVTPSDYKNYGKKANSSIRKLSQVGRDRQKNRLLPTNSVLVTCIGSDMGKTVVNAAPCVSNQQINAIIPDVSIVDADYLYYVTVDLYETFRSLGGDGTAVPILNKSDFENIDISLPIIPEQRAIAAILSSLDDKIDLLHRQNQTLEAMAATLFRQWFVEEAQVGEREVKLGDIATTVSGFNHTQEQLSDSGDYLLSMGSVVKSYGISMSGTRYVNADDVPDKYLCKVGDIVLTTRDVTQNADLLGSPGIIPSYFAKAKVVVGSNLYKLELHDDGIGRSVIYEALRASRYREFVKEVASGTSILMLKKSDLMEYKFLVPPEGRLQEATNKLAMIHKKLDVNFGAILLYEKLRDTLLPKLMSGEIRVAY